MHSDSRDITISPKCQIFVCYVTIPARLAAYAHLNILIYASNSRRKQIQTQLIIKSEVKCYSRPSITTILEINVKETWCFMFLMGEVMLKTVGKNE